MNIKYAFLLALALLAGCNEEQALTNQASASTVKLQDGSEIALSGKVIDSSKRPNAEGVMNITKLQFQKNVKVVQAEFDSKLKALGYTPYSMPSSEGIKFNYTKPSASTIGVFLKSTSINDNDVSSANIYWHEKKPS